MFGRSLLLIHVIWKNILLYVWLYRRDILLTVYRAAGLLVNMLKDNIKMDIKETCLWIADSTWSLYNLKIKVFSHDIWQIIMNILPSWSTSEKPLCTYTVWYRLLMISYATLTQLHTKASNISKGFFKRLGTADITQPNKSLSPPHIYLVKHCV